MSVKTTMTVDRAAEALGIGRDCVERRIGLGLLHTEVRSGVRHVVVDRGHHLRIDEIPFAQVPQWVSRICGVDITPDRLFRDAASGRLRARWTVDLTAPIACTIAGLHEWAAGLLPSRPGVLLETPVHPLRHLTEVRQTQKRRAS